MYAFLACINLTSVTIPDSVISIGPKAFWNCHSLTSVTIGNGVINVGYYAFLDCDALTSVTIPNSVTNIELGVFEGCHSLTNVTIGNSVISIGDWAFQNCASLTGIYFQGNAPSLGGSYVFSGDNHVTVYYLPGTTGWFSSFGGLPTELWLPYVQASNTSFGVQSNQFRFSINWASGQTVVVEACTNLANPIWSPVGTNTLTSGSSCFSDSGWTNYPGRFYRLRSP
jgi:hypothetical protein